ncbi:MAG: FHA domain-containing protein [Planctomycetota bacterium]|nr:FHA domain-containing protein [Planctomycetota bacterium]
MKSWLIGGASECDLIVDVDVVSAHHCRLTQASDGFYVEDLGSTNGTFVNGERLAGKVRISLADSVTLGRDIKMPWPEVALRTIAPDSAAQKIPTAQQVLTIGRAPDCDLVVDSPSVSNLHARLFVRAENTLLEDLSSDNGTYVDGRKITRALLSKSSSVRLGDYDVPPSLINKYLPAGPVDSSSGATE